MNYNEIRDIFKNIKNKIDNNKNNSNKIKNMDYSHIFSSKNKIKNRLYFDNLTDDEFFINNNIKQECYKFYNKIAKTNVGIIITGGIYAENYKNNQKEGEKQRFKSDLLQLSQTIRQYNCLALLKIKTGYGRNNKNKLFNTFRYTTTYSKDPKNISCPTIRISDKICKKLVNQITNIALQSNELGFDGIVIDASNNILGELSSVEFNNRIFGYFSNINDILSNILIKINEKCGNIFTIIKFNVNSLSKILYENLKPIKSLSKQNDSNYNEIFNLLKNLINNGADGFEFNFGNYETEMLNDFNQFMCEDLFDEFYKSFRKFLIENNVKNKFGDEILLFYYDNYSNLLTANNLIKENTIDFVNITKQIYADENYIKKLKKGNSYNNCIKCNFCSLIKDKYSKIECCINPSLKYYHTLIREKHNERVAIVGSGISGLTCAITLVERGYNVELFEEDNIINKNGRIQTIFNSDKLLNNYYEQIENKIENYVSKNKITLNLSTKFSIKNEIQNNYEYIIIATGFKTRYLSITGSILNHVKSIYEILTNEEILHKSKNIVIYLKSELSLKLALFISNFNNNLKIIIKNCVFLNNIPHSNLIYYFYILSSRGIKIMFQTQIIKINEDNIEIISNKNLKDDTLVLSLNYLSNYKYKYEPIKSFLDCDLFIYEPDIYPNNSLYYELSKSKFKGELYLIGEALQIGNLADDIKSGYFVGKNL